MNLVELDRAFKKLRLGGMAAILETRLQQARSERMAPIDLISALMQDELTRRADRLVERRRKQAAFRDPDKRREFRLRLQQEDGAPPRLRAGHRSLHRRT